MAKNKATTSEMKGAMELPFEQDNKPMPKKSGKMKVEKKRKHKGVHFDDMTPEQQAFIKSFSENASDAASKNIARAFGFTPEPTTRQVLIPLYATGPFPNNRMSWSVPQAFESNVKKELRKKMGDSLTVKYGGKEFKVHFTKSGK